MMRRSLLTLVVVSTLSLGLAARADANAIRIPCNASTLDSYINTMNGVPGTVTLSLEPGCTYLFTAHSQFAGGLALPQITDDLRIVGNGAMLLRNSQEEFRILSIAAAIHVTISGLTISGGHAPDGASATKGDCGGGIVNRGYLALHHVSVTGNVAGTGGGGSSSAADGGNGGGICNIGDLTLDHSKVTTNYAGAGGTANDFGGDGGVGGGIFNTGTLHVTSSTVKENHAGPAGPATVGQAGAAGLGGGIYNDALAIVTMSGSSVVRNLGGLDAIGSPSGDGGGIYNAGEHITPHTSTIKNNVPDNCAPPGTVSRCKS